MTWHVGFRSLVREGKDEQSGGRVGGLACGEMMPWEFRELARYSDRLVHSAAMYSTKSLTPGLRTVFQPSLRSGK